MMLKNNQQDLDSASNLYQHIFAFVFIFYVDSLALLFLFIIADKNTILLYQWKNMLTFQNSSIFLLTATFADAGKSSVYYLHRLNEIRTRTNVYVKTLRSDNAKEYVSKSFSLISFNKVLFVTHHVLTQRLEWDSRTKKPTSS